MVNCPGVPQTLVFGQEPWMQTAQIMSALLNAHSIYKFADVCLAEPPSGLLSGWMRSTWTPEASAAKSTAAVSSRRRQVAPAWRWSGVASPPSRRLRRHWVLRRPVRRRLAPAPLLQHRNLGAAPGWSTIRQVLHAASPALALSKSWRGDQHATTWLHGSGTITTPPTAPRRLLGACGLSHRPRLLAPELH